MSPPLDVLVIDDEEVVAAAARRILQSEGLSVDMAENAEIGMQKLGEQHYGIVLCDLMLPRVNGFDLIRFVRREAPDTPVILITGYATHANAVHAFLHGAFDFIPKPFDFEELVGVVLRGLKFARSDASSVQAIALNELALSDTPISNGIEGLYALGGHGWAVVQQDGTALLGLGESFAALDDAIESVEFPGLGDDILQGNRCVRFVGTNELVYRFWAPLSGRVIETSDQVFSEAGPGRWSRVCRKSVLRMVPSNLEDELPNMIRR